MNIGRFLEHWSLSENPFRAEEARHDAVFARIGAAGASHPDFEKVLGDPLRPAAAIVFGEKGSGKTAMRFQIEEHLRRHNEANPDKKILLTPYDDLNLVLDRFCARADRSDSKELLAKLKELSVTDHLDGILHAAVPMIVDAALTDAASWRALRRAPAEVKNDLLLLQALYDRDDGYAWRAARLRRRIGAPWNGSRLLWKGLAVWGWIPAAAIGAASFLVSRDTVAPMVWLYGLYAALAVWALLLFNWFIVEQLRLRRLAGRAARRLRFVSRRAGDLAGVLGRIAPDARRSSMLPVEDTEEERYSLVARLRRVSGVLGYAGLVVIVDRVDEPAVVSGDPDRMRAVVWPMLTNKFLQQEGVGVKLLLPVELRHELFRESSSFFQEARLDKQNLIERLSWTGPILFDLCNARLRACASTQQQPPLLTDIFDDDTSRQDIIDALDQMRQPRDAFKLLYQCINEFCAGATEDTDRWRIPRHILDAVRKQQVERVQMLQRGYRPG